MRMLAAIFLPAQHLIMGKQGKKLSELSVVDLRRIFEKRGLDKTGNKSVLVDRLSKCLTDEGHDANIYVHSVNVEEDMANDSQLSDVGQLEDSLRESESKETISDGMADDTELIDEDNEADQPSGEELSFQEPDKMVEVDSLHHEWTEFSNLLQEESVDGAESTTTARKGSTCVDNGVIGVGADTTQGTEERTSSDVTDKGIENEFSDLNRLADTVLEVTSTKTEQTRAEAGGTFVVHIDESDMNLDYDLPGDKWEERDVPTPTKDESNDVDSADIVQSTENASSGKEAGKREEAARGSGQAGSKRSAHSLSDPAYIKDSLKACYDLTHHLHNRLGKGADATSDRLSSALDELYVTGPDSEQIWQQLEHSYSQITSVTADDVPSSRTLSLLIPNYGNKSVVANDIDEQSESPSSMEGDEDFNAEELSDVSASSADDEGSEEEEEEKEDNNSGQLRERIAAMEGEALSDKPWQLKGEVTAKSRPENSLIQEAVEFNANVAPVPAITMETTQNLETLIMQRIKDKAFDDVERKTRLKEDGEKYKKCIELDHEKSKQSLSQIYEQEYLKLRDNEEDEEDKEDPEEAAIKRMMSSLFCKLDALSSFHYTPKPAPKEIKIVSHLPTVVMEEVQPDTVADSAQLAPEEIKRSRAEVKDKSERDETDKKRVRRQKKAKNRKTENMKKKVEARVQKINPGLGNKRAEQRSIEAIKQAVVNEGRVIKPTKESLMSDKTYSSSKEFFKALQTEVKLDKKSIRTKADLRKKNTVSKSAEKLKL